MIIVEAQYFYLLLTIPFLALWAVFYLINKSTRSEQLLLSTIGAIVGPISEIIYFKDYWTPLSVLQIQIGNFPLMIEDVLFGFAIMGIAGTIYEVFRKTRSLKYRKKPPHSYRSIHILLLFISMLTIGIALGMNSIYASALAFIITAVPMIWLRPDLLLDAIGSAIGVVIVMFSCYFLVFSLASNMPQLMQQGWHLYGTGLDRTILGIPLTEMVWGFSVGFLIGPLYEFLRNQRLSLK